MSVSSSIVLGITGGIACGKSEAGRALSAEGFKVLDCDFLAHELMNSGRPVYSQIVHFFGKDILADDGEIDRKKLGARVFENEEERATLNRLVHPAVITAVDEWIAECRAAKENAAVLVPLLFEAEWTAGWDAIICISSLADLMIARLMQSRGFTEEEARRRIAAQMPVAEKAARADYAVLNESTLESLHRQIVDLAQRIKSEKKEQ